MALVDAKQNEKANRRYKRIMKKYRTKTMAKAISEVVGSYNIVGQTTGFKKDGIYQVTWLVGGKPVGNALLTIPSHECKHITPDEWFKQYVEMIMYAYDLEHADVMVSEVINDVKTVHPV